MTTLDSDTPDNNDPPEIEGEDYYFDGPYLVFTEAYHRRRGFCCHSGCRHCPYGFGGTGSPAPDVSGPKPD